MAVGLGDGPEPRGYWEDELRYAELVSDRMREAANAGELSRWVDGNWELEPKPAKPKRKGNQQPKGYASTDRRDPRRVTFDVRKEIGSGYRYGQDSYTYHWRGYRSPGDPMPTEFDPIQHALTNEAFTSVDGQTACEMTWRKKLPGLSKLSLTPKAKGAKVEVSTDSQQGAKPVTTYVKHSSRTLRTGCSGCQTKALYYAHEVTGDPDPDLYCQTCKATGPLVIVDAATIRPHACTTVNAETGVRVEGVQADNADTAEVEGDGSPDRKPGEGEAWSAGDESEAEADADGDPWLSVPDKPTTGTPLGPVEGEGAEVKASIDTDKAEQLIKALQDALGQQQSQGDDDNDFVTHPELDEKASELVGFFADELEKQTVATDEMITKAIDAAKKDANTKPLRVEISQGGEVVRAVEGLAHRALPDVILTVDAGEYALLIGPAGTGKGKLARQTAEALELEFYALPGSLSPQTPVSQIIGYMQAEGKYVGTLFRKAYEFGGLMFFDELDNAHPSCLAAINDALAADEIAFPDGMVAKHEKFTCVAAANTFGRGPDRTYAARQRGDAATWDRFTILHVPYDEALEHTLCKRTGADPSVVAEVLRYTRSLRRNAEREELPVVVGQRATVAMCKLIRRGMDPSKAVDARLRRGMSDQDWRKLVGDTRPLELQSA